MRYTIAILAVVLVLGAQALSAIPPDQMLENLRRGGFRKVEDVEREAALNQVLTSVGASNTQYNPSKDLMNVSLGNYWQTPLTGTKAMPMTVDAAYAAGWEKYKPNTSKGENGADCIPGLGRLFYRKKGSNAGNGDQITSDNSVSLYFAQDGKISGIRVNIFGKQSETLFSKGVGNAAQDKLVDQGFWIKDFANDGWYMSVSFRAKGMMCNGGSSGTETIGNMLVINQHEGGIARKIPMTADEAKTENFQAGSCMAKMGQHWLYDLDMAPKMSWKARNLMPVVPMYHLVGPKIGKLNAFFFNSPVCQNKDSGDWDVVPLPFVCALTSSMMCENLCNSKCEWDSSWYATQHVFFTQDLSTVTCPNPVSLLDDALLYAAGGSCPANTPTPVHPESDPNRG